MDNGKDHFTLWVISGIIGVVVRDLYDLAMVLFAWRWNPLPSWRNVEWKWQARQLRGLIRSGTTSAAMPEGLTGQAEIALHLLLSAAQGEGRQETRQGRESPVEQSLISLCLSRLDVWVLWPTWSRQAEMTSSSQLSSAVSMQSLGAMTRVP